MSSLVSNKECSGDRANQIMPTLAFRRFKALKVGSIMKCADNTGAKYLKIIDVLGKGSRKNRLKSAKLGDIVKVAVKSGIPKYQKKMALALVIRAKRAYYDACQGTYVYFTDNAGVLVQPNGTPIGSVARGVVPRFICQLKPFFKPSGCRFI